MEESSMGGGEMVCPKCSAAITPDDKFCAACGAGVAIASDGVVRAQDPPPATTPPPLDAPAAGGPVPVPYSVIEARARASKLATARKLLLAMSIITLIAGVGMYIFQRRAVEKQIADLEVQMADIDPEERDANMKSRTGMTWEQAKARDRGEVNLHLAINIGLAVFYFGMWLWARKNVLAAAITALLLYVTVLAVNGALEPKTLLAGYQLKVGFIAILVLAIDAGYKARRAEAT
jgi:hypothetical protein